VGAGSKAKAGARERVVPSAGPGALRYFADFL
jgi:hypothetical protein